MATRLLRVVPASLRDEPFEVFTAALFLIAGVPQALGVVSAGSLSVLLPKLAVHLWGSCLVVGSSLVLIGLVMASRATSLGLRLRGRAIERLGLVLLAWVVAIYSVSILALAGRQGLLSATICAVFVVACIIRALVIQEINTRVVREALAEPDSGVPDAEIVVQAEQVVAEEAG